FSLLLDSKLLTFVCNSLTWVFKPSLSLTTSLYFDISLFRLDSLSFNSFSASATLDSRLDTSSLNWRTLVSRSLTSSLNLSKSSSRAVNSLSFSSRSDFNFSILSSRSFKLLSKSSKVSCFSSKPRLTSSKLPYSSCNLLISCAVVSLSVVALSIVKYKASIHTNNTTLNKDNNPTPTLYFFRLSNTLSCSSELILPFDSLPCMSLAYSPCCTSLP